MGRPVVADLPSIAVYHSCRQPCYSLGLTDERAIFWSLKFVIISITERLLYLKAIDFLITFSRKNFLPGGETFFPFYELKSHSWLISADFTRDQKSALMIGSGSHHINAKSWIGCCEGTERGLNPGLSTIIHERSSVKGLYDSRHPLGRTSAWFMRSEEFQSACMNSLSK